MAKSILVFVLGLTTLAYLQAQDSIFVDFNYDQIWRNIWGSVDFSTDPPILSPSFPEAFMKESVTGILDPNLDVLFFSNGSYVFSDLGDTIPGSDSLSMHPSTVSSYLFVGLPRPDMVLMLPGFEEEEFTIFHQSTRFGTLDTSGTIDLVIDHLLMSKLSINNEYPHGAVSNKNNIVFSDSLDVNIAGIRHGNGRDWWMALGGRSGRNEHHLLLYDPTGVHEIPTQTFSPDSLVIGRGQSVFSPDGKTYAKIKFIEPFEDNKANLLIYEFDRCTGELKNQRIIKMPIEYEGFGSLGLSFSSNSRFIYVSQASHVFQYDLFAENIEDSYTVLFNYHDYPESLVVANGLPFTSRLAPNGRIYLGSLGTRPHWFSIRSPNLRGLASTFLYPDPDVIFPVNVTSALPNSPPYGLGPLDGSPCDTLNISHPAPIAGFDYLSTDSTNIAEFFDESSVYTTDWFWEFGDGDTDTSQFPVHEYLDNGTYYVCLTATSLNGSDTYCDSVKVGLPIINSIEGIEEELSLTIYPNPTDGQLIVEHPEGGHIQLSTITGQTIKDWTVFGPGVKEIDLSGYPKGVYMLIFRKESGETRRARIVVE